MATWPRHIDRFERKYDKAFAVKPFFRAEIFDCTHKRVVSLPALGQHDMPGRRGDGSTVIVQRDPAVCGTVRVDYIHPFLGGVSGIQWGREKEVRERQWWQTKPDAAEVGDVK